MNHKELFTAYYPGKIPITVMQTDDGHIYPEGAPHDCNHPDCPASYEDAPATDLGTAGPVEQEFWREFGVDPTEEVLELMEEARTENGISN